MAFPSNPYPQQAQYSFVPRKDGRLSWPWAAYLRTSPTTWEPHFLQVGSPGREESFWLQYGSLPLCVTKGSLLHFGLQEGLTKGSLLLQNGCRLSTQPFCERCCNRWQQHLFRKRTWRSIYERVKFPTAKCFVQIKRKGNGIVKEKWPATNL